MGRKVRRDPIDRIRSEVAQFRKSAVELGVKKIRLDQLSRKDDPDWRDSLTPKKREAKWRKINRSYQAGKRSLRASEQRLQVSVSEHKNEMPSDLSIKVKFAQCLAHVASKTVEREDVEFLNLPCGYPEKVKPEAVEPNEVEPNAVKRDRTVDIIYVKYVLVLVLQGMLKVDDRSDCADPGGTSWNLFRSLKKPVAVCIALLRGVFGNRRMDFEVDATGRRVPGEITLGNIDNVELVNDPELSHEFFAEVKKLNEEQRLERSIEESLLKGGGVLSEGEEDESILSEGDSGPVQAEIVRDLHREKRRLGLEALLSNPRPARLERRRRRSSDIQ